MRLTWGFLLICAPAALSQSVAPRFARFHSGEGLSHNSVYAIMQDHDGYMWFGTLDGLDRYDGYEFLSYRHDPTDSTTLSNNLIRALLEDAQGHLWVATEQGINKLDRRTGRFVRYAVPPDQFGQRTVHALAETEDGAIWAGAASGLLRLDVDVGQFVPTTGWRADRAAAHLGLDALGRLWTLATPTGTDSDEAEALGADLIRVDGQGRPVEQYALTRDWGVVFRFLFDAEGRLWVNARGPARLDTRGIRPPHPDRPAYAYALARAPDGTVWIGTSDGTGVCRVAPREFVPDCHLLDTENQTWLHTYVRSLYLDRAGALWVGTYSGVYRHDPHAKPFRVLRHDPTDPNTLSVDAVSAVDRTADGMLWVGTFGGGIDRIDPATGEVRRFRLDSGRTGDPVVWHLHVDRQGRLWAATGIGLMYYDPAADRFRHGVETLAGREVSNIIYVEEDGDGGLWLGSFSGLFYFDPHTGRSRYFGVTGDSTGLRQPRVTGLLADGRTLWIASGQGELARMELDTERFTHYEPRTADGATLDSEGAYDLHRTADGTLWLGTGAGLHRFDPGRGTFRNYGVREGLPGGVVYSIAEDGRGRLWLGTSRGLARFDPDTETFRAYDRADGIGSVEFNRHATFRDPDGTLYFGGVEGLTVFDPETILNNPHAPPVVFTAIETAGRDGLTVYEPFALDRLELSHRETSVTFAFAALSFTDPEKNRYAYQLEGLDVGWVDAGTQRVARYTSLPPGRYTFRVRGTNNDGVWSPESAALAVTVLPPYWQTPWFRLLVLGAVAGLLALAYRVRVRRLLELERLRLRIAGDLHDELASDLSGIALVTDLLQRHDVLPVDDRRQLVEIRDTALEMVEALRDIVWTINPEHDSLEAMVRRMRQVAARLLCDLEYSFEAEVSSGAGAVAMTVRRDVLLIYKEALHNAARHSGAEHVTIRLAQHDGRLDLVVEDDGCGFDPAEPRGGYGLGSMRARAERLGAVLDVASQPGEGTRLRLRVRLNRPRSGR